MNAGEVVVTVVALICYTVAALGILVLGAYLLGGGGRDE